jgi:hypothetical protein
MERQPLAALISGRGFDKYRPGLAARFKAFGLGYELTYCEPTDNPAMRLDFESPIHLGRITAWESGECNLEVLEISTGKTVLQDHQLSNEGEFHSILPKLVLFMRDAVGRPTTPA